MGWLYEDEGNKDRVVMRKTKGHEASEILLEYKRIHVSGSTCKE